MTTRSKAAATPFNTVYSIALNSEITAVVLEPNTVFEALYSLAWKGAMQSEFDALMKNDTWILVPPLPDKNVVGSKWVFRTNYNADASLQKYKARLIAKRFQQTPGLDYFKTFSPVIKPSIIRIILTLAVTNGWDIQQVDVNNAFLNGTLNEKVYMSQPIGFEDPARPSYVCKLNKALYGLKHALRAWFDKPKTALYHKGFQNSVSDSSLFVLCHNSFFTYSKYASDLLSKTEMLDFHAYSTPMAVGTKLCSTDSELFADPSLYRNTIEVIQYLTLTRPDISFPVNKLSQLLDAPTEVQWQACKRILRYIKGTQHYVLHFKPASTLKVECYANADWRSNLEDRRSTSGYCVYMGPNLIQWSFRKQKVVAFSSTETEYRALAHTTTEIAWLQSLFTELALQVNVTPVIWCDNVSAGALATNLVIHVGTKHIEIDAHYIREQVLAKKTAHTNPQRISHSKRSPELQSNLRGNVNIRAKQTAVSTDYGLALSKSLLFYEAQRSGKLPPDQRVTWRADSALKDGSDVGVDLVGGYYDAGDNVKFGFPMAFTVTMLSWSTIEFKAKLAENKEFRNALSAIKWGTDYFLKAHPKPDVLYGQVGDGDSDHACWQRPEDMTTPRTAFKIDAQHPGADLAAETAAALAAASIAFKNFDRKYSETLVTHAKQLFEFARNNPGLYQNSIPGAGNFYSSSGCEDELLWAATWLQRATKEKMYLDFIGKFTNTGGKRTSFSWDDKFLGAQVLASRLVFMGKAPNSGKWAEYKSQAEQFICSCVQNGDVKKTSGGLLWFMPWNNLQYTATATFIATVYSKYLKAANSTLKCPSGNVQPTDLMALTRVQADYILGKNPMGMSYMVGFGSKYPTQPHHRGASIVSIKKDHTPVSCKGGFDSWFNKNEPNQNVLEGAIVGGPDENDKFSDSRSNYQLSETTTVTPAPLVGVFASLA
ncbi:endoglucanase 15-like [Pistacia vera]|uniref:endoglucanase 15-like n=1 Tax=Pistacia vera TaxID=55513 RepID=UPI0012635FD5|nr:endoglucanase 15-like [Pistacia vera]